MTPLRNRRRAKPRRSWYDEISASINRPKEVKNGNLPKEDSLTVWEGAWDSLAEITNEEIRKTSNK